MLPGDVGGERGGECERERRGRDGLLPPAAADTSAPNVCNAPSSSSPDHASSPIKRRSSLSAALLPSTAPLPSAAPLAVGARRLALAPRTRFWMAVAAAPCFSRAARSPLPRT